MQSNEQALYEAIKSHFQTDQRRVRFLAMLIVALLKLADSSLAQWCLAINQTTQRDSRFKRLQRLLGQFNFSARMYAQIIWRRYGQDPEVVLTLDRSEYKQRGRWIQILLLGIAHQGTSVPLLWHTANRQGNSAAIARQLLLKTFQDWIQPVDRQRVYLTADREFIGPEFRQTRLIPLIRIRSNAVVSYQGRQQRVSALFDSPTWRILRQPRQLYQRALYLSGMRLSDGDYLIVYSDRYVSQSQRLYGLRWQVETLFGAFKSRGFDLEQCRVNQHQRIRRLLFMLSIALVWALETGQWLLATGRKRASRQFNGQVRYLYSLFRWGLDELRDRVLNNKSIHSLIPVLSCT